MNYYINLKKKEYTKFNKFIKDKKKCNLCKNEFNRHIYFINNNHLCSICYLINNCDLNTDLFFDLCYSKMSQKEVVCKTYNFIYNNKRIPNITDIDNNAMDIKLSIIELIEVLRNIDNIPNFFNNYKLFLNYNFNIDHLIKKSKFLSDDDNININTNKDIFIENKNSLNKYKMKLNEYDFIYNSLYN
jgi:hypothetical protein